MEEILVIERTMGIGCLSREQIVLLGFIIKSKNKRSFKLAEKENTWEFLTKSSAH